MFQSPLFNGDIFKDPVVQSSVQHKELVIDEEDQDENFIRIIRVKVFIVT